MTFTGLTTDCRLLCAATCTYDILASGTFTPVSPHYNAVGWTTAPHPYVAGPENINACLIGTNQQDGAILAFRGTLPPTNPDVLPQLRDWLQDFMAEPVARPGILPPGMMVHLGFWNAVDSLWQQILPTLQALAAAHPQPKLYVTGHSKGGAMAAIAAARLLFHEKIPVEAVYLYAAARAGNSPFVSGFPSGVPVLRYEHYLDIVPLVPPNLQFIDCLAPVPELGDLFKDAKDWDYTSLGTLRYIKEDGTIIGDDPLLHAIRTGEIVAAVASGHLVDIARAHAPWCRGILSDGGYVLGLCPPNLCASPA